MTVEIKQCDRDAAVNAMNSMVDDGFAVGCCTLSTTDGHEIAAYISEAFARHRIAAEQHQPSGDVAKMREAAIDAVAKIEMDREGYPLSRTQEEIYSDAAETVDAVLSTLTEQRPGVVAQCDISFEELIEAAQEKGALVKAGILNEQRQEVST